MWELIGPNLLCHALINLQEIEEVGGAEELEKEVNRRIKKSKTSM